MYRYAGSGVIENGISLSWKNSMYMRACRPRLKSGGAVYVWCADAEAETQSGAVSSETGAAQVVQAIRRRARRSPRYRSEEHTSELQSLMRISYAVLCLKKKNK